MDGGDEVTHYSENPGMVQVDFFKASGKWYMTEALDMTEYWDAPSPIHGVEYALEKAGRNLRHFTIVCLEPYHRNAYPVMLPAIATE